MSHANIRTFRVPRDVVRATQRHLRAKRRIRHEGVVLWRGVLEDALITAAIVPHQQTTAVSFRVPLAERQRLAHELAGTGEMILVQVHSHPTCAYHSSTDNRDAVPRRVGSLSLVVPDYGARRDLLDGAALYERHADGRWIPAPLGRLRLPKMAAKR